MKTECSTVVTGIPVDVLPPAPTTPVLSGRLVSFLYILLRDHLPSGVVEGIMHEHVEKLAPDGIPVADGEVRYSNPHVEAHARELAARLVPAKP